MEKYLFTYELLLYLFIRDKRIAIFHVCAFSFFKNRKEEERLTILFSLRVEIEVINSDSIRFVHPRWYR